VLLNDWSARDIQAWEYQPLGPFQAKATATTISPWIVPAAALDPFRCATPARETELLPHLRDTGPMLYDIALNVTQRGSLLELSWGGKEPLTLPNGETRSFINDGDTLALHGAAKGDGYQIGFGDCTGTLLPAHDDPFKG